MRGKAIGLGGAAGLALAVCAALLLSLPTGLAGAPSPPGAVQAPSAGEATRLATVAALLPSTTGRSGAASPATPNCDPLIAIILCIGTSSSVGSLTYATTFTPSSISNADRIFFSICDTNYDQEANVSIVDQNYTRDALPAVAFSQTIRIVQTGTTGCLGTWNESSDASSYVFYTIPSDLADGGQWWFNVSTGTGAGHTVSVVFHVVTYYVVLTGDQVDHLPGDHATAYYQVLSYASQGPVASAVSMAANGLYENQTDAVNLVPGMSAPPSSAQGSVAFTVPASALVGSAVAVRFWANLSGTTNSVTALLAFTVDSLAKPALCGATTTDGGASPCPSGPYAFPQGTQLVLREVVCMTAAVTDCVGAQAVPNASLTLHLLNEANGIPVTPTGFPSSVTADASGTARQVLNTSSVAPAAYELNVNVTDPQNSAIWSVANFFFNITGPIAVAVEITFQQSQYFGGDTVNGTFQLVQPGVSSTPPPFWTAYAYQVYFDAGASVCPAGPVGQLEVQGNLSGVSGRLPAYTLELSMQGLIEFDLQAHNGSSTTSKGVASIACVLASPPQITVNPSEVDYLPGDTITVSISTQGSVLSASGTRFYATVLGYGAVTGTNPCTGTLPSVLFGEELAGPSFSFAIPREGTATCYEMSVSAETSSGFVVGEDLALTELEGYALSVSITTVSKYTDGSYQPGETLSLSYAISPLGSPGVPTDITLGIYSGTSCSPAPATCSPLVRVQQASASGSLSFTIPSDQGAGLMILQVVAGVLSPVFGTVDVSVLTGVNVEPNPSWLGLELSAGSLFTYGELLIVVIIAALVAVALVLWARGRTRRRRQHMREEHPLPPPPAGTPSTGGWAGEGAADAGAPSSSNPDEVAPMPGSAGTAPGASEPAPPYIPPGPPLPPPPPLPPSSPPRWP